MLKRRTERRQVARGENETLRIVVFVVGAERYGLEISGVREIVRTQQITKVPEALPFVEGVVRLREQIIPVIDLARRFGLPAHVPELQTRVIIACLQGQLVGLIVSAVEEVVALPTRDVGPVPPLTLGRSARFVTGMARVGESLVSILSLDKLLSTEEVEQLQHGQPAT